MKAFLCSNGVLSSADAPQVTGTSLEIAKQLGFALFEVLGSRDSRSRGYICRPINNQEVYFTIHGNERSMYALVIWEFDESPTFLLAPSPFDLVTAVEYVARFEKALYEANHYSRLLKEMRQEAPRQRGQ